MPAGIEGPLRSDGGTGERGRETGKTQDGHGRRSGHSGQSIGRAPCHVACRVVYMPRAGLSLQAIGEPWVRRAAMVVCDRVTTVGDGVGGDRHRVRSPCSCSPSVLSGGRTGPGWALAR